MEAVITAFGKHRLLSFDRDPETRGPTVEVAHEALLRAWMRLRGWIDAAREDVITHTRLSGEAAEWERGGRDPSFLLRGSRLAHLEGWAGSTTLALSAAERSFLADSVAAGEAQEAGERTRAERERDLERRSVRRLRGLVAVLAAAALVASTLVVVAVSQRSNARDQASIAQARELAAAADANLSIDPERSVLLALEAVGVAGPDGQPLPEAVQSLQGAVAANRLLMTLPDASTGNVAYSPDGRLIATGGSVGGITQTDVLLWDAYTGQLVQRLRGHTADIWSVWFDPTGRLLVSTSDNHDAIIWDVATGKDLHHLKDFGVSANFDPSGTKIMAANGSVVNIAEVDTGRIVDRLSQPGADLCSPTFSPDGSWIATGLCHGSGVEIWDVATHHVKMVLGRNDNVGFGGGIFSPDGSQIASNGGQNGTYVWSFPSGKPMYTITDYRGAAYGLGFSSDGTRLATSGTDGTARIWDARNGQQQMVLAGSQGLVGMVAFSPDGTRVVTGGADGMARIWDVSSPGPGLAMASPTDGLPLFSLAYAPDGQLFTSGWNSGWIWDTALGDRLRSVENTWGGAGSVNPDGSLVSGYTYAGSDAAGIWEFATGRRVGVLKTPTGVTSTSFAGNGTIALGLACCGTPAALVWDSTSPERAPVPFGRPTSDIASTEGVSLTQDGSTLAVIDGRGTLHVWDVSSKDTVFVARAQSGQGQGVAFSPDGTTIATAGGEGVTLLDVTTGRRLATFGGVGQLRSVAFSPDGKFVAGGGADARATIWEVATGARVLTLGGLDDAAINSVAFSPDGSLLTTGDDGGSLRGYALRIDDLEHIATSEITRGLTDEECAQYLHESPCPSGVAKPTPTDTASALASPLEGAFRTDISFGELVAAGVDDREARDSLGGWTLDTPGWRVLLAPGVSERLDLADLRDVLHRG